MKFKDLEKNLWEMKTYNSKQFSYVKEELP